jgi:hypothetical protein
MCCNPNKLGAGHHLVRQAVNPAGGCSLSYINTHLAQPKVGTTFPIYKLSLL